MEPISPVNCLDNDVRVVSGIGTCLPAGLNPLRPSSFGRPRSAARAPGPAGRGPAPSRTPRGRNEQAHTSPKKSTQILRHQTFSIHQPAKCISALF
eukprot:scaffold76588_cov17-Prasinocladus_malaysianus.AAC.1